MQFPTLEFAVFFTLCLTLTWALRSQRVLQKLVLLAASYYFYARIDLRFVTILAVSSVLNYVVGEGIARGRGPGARRAWLVIGVIVNLAMLAAFKYYAFFQDSLGDFLAYVGLPLRLPVLEILLPVGISFYTFQALSYIIDLYRGGRDRAQSWLDFLLYMAFFPKLLAGPICRARELLPQIAAPAPRSVPEVSRAATLILSGLFKKAVLATLIDTHLVAAAFDAPENYGAGALWMAMLGYSMQIYWDFSGYTDLALGLGLLLGFRLPQNFEHPYTATDISDFWRRWHITFSSWLRDYLFFPLATRWSAALRARMSLRRAALWGAQLAVLVTFVLCGLWHGAGWTFVLWGAYHGVLLFIHHGLRDGLRMRWNGGWLGRAGTFLLVSLGWVLFNSPDLASAMTYLKGMFAFGHAGNGFELLILLLIVVGVAMHIWGPRLRSLYVELSERMPWGVRPVVWFATGMVILAVKPSGIAPYIYFGF